MTDVKLTMALEGLNNINAGLKQLNEKFDQFGKTIKGAADQAKGMAGSLSLLKWDTLARYGSQAVGYLVNLEESMENTARQASRLGVSFEGLQKLQLTAKRFGAEVGQLEVAMRQFNKQMGDASIQATGTSARLFRALGVEIKDAGGQMRSTEDVFRDTVDALQTVGNRADQSRLVFALFGEQAGNLMDLFTGGTGQLDKFGDHLQSLGAITSEKFAPTLRDANSIVYDFQDTLEGLVKQTMAGAILAFEDLGKSIGSFSSDMQALAGVDVKGPAFDAAKGRDMLAGFRKDFMTKRDVSGALDPNAARAAAEAERQQKRQAQILGDLRAEYAALQKGVEGYDREMAVHNALTAAGVTAKSALGREIVSLIDKIEEQRQAQEEAEAAFQFEAERTNAIIAERRAIFDDTRTAAERFNMEMGRLKELELDDDTMNRASKQLAQDLADADPIARRLGDSLGDIFDRAIDGGEKFGDILKGVGKDLLKTVGRQALNPFSDMLTRGASSVMRMGKGAIGGDGEEGQAGGDMMQTIFTDFLGGLSEIFGGGDEGFLGGLSKLFMGDEGILGGLSGIFGSAWEMLTSTLAWFIGEEWALAGWDIAERWALAIWEDIQRWAVAIFEAAASALGFERGGDLTVTRPTLIMVGEKNKAERVRVSPLAGGVGRGTNRGGGGGASPAGGEAGVQVFLPQSSVVSNITAGTFARQVARTVRRENARLV